MRSTPLVFRAKIWLVVENLFTFWFLVVPLRALEVPIGLHSLLILTCIFTRPPVYQIWWQSDRMPNGKRPNYYKAELIFRSKNSKGRMSYYLLIFSLYIRWIELILLVTHSLAIWAFLLGFLARYMSFGFRLFFHSAL